MTRKLLSAAMILIASSNALIAQDSTKSVAFSGSVDAYYRYNFAGQEFTNNYTSFTNSQSAFELGMASVRADASAASGKVTAVVDLGFGTRAEEFSYNDANTLLALKQAYVTYAPSSKVKFTLGKFGTHIGYELLDAPLNRNYSMSYMFTNGPFFNTGLKADIVAGPVGIMVGVSNYTDEIKSTTNVRSLIAQVSGASKSGKVKAYLNYTGFFGSKAGLNPSELESLNQVDLVVTGVVTDKFNIGFNGTVQSRNATVGGTDGSWWGSALYLNFDPTAAVGVTLRSEYIGDKKLVYYGTKNIFANTLSLNYKVGPLTLIPELRFESADSEIYGDKDGLGTKSTFTALLAAVYKF